MPKSTDKKPTPRKRAPAKPKKTDVAEGVEAATELVEPLNQQAFQMVMQIIDNADFKGGDMAAVLNLRRELARVANIKPQAPGPRA